MYGRGRGGPSTPLPPPSLSFFVSSAHFLAMDSPVFFLQSLLCLAAARKFLVFRNFLLLLNTMASHPFLGFLAGHPLKFPSRIHFGILLTNILTTCLAHCNLLTHVYETGQFFLTVYNSSLYCASNAINLDWFRYSLEISLTKNHLCKHINSLGSNPMPRIKPYRKLECEDSVPTAVPYQSLRMLLSLPQHKNCGDIFENKLDIKYKSVSQIYMPCLQQM
jgi:hypothetical protein